MVAGAVTAVVSAVAVAVAVLVVVDAGVASTCVVVAV